MKREKIFQQYLDGELSPDQEKEVLHMIAEDREMRSLLHFEMKVHSYFNSRTESELRVPAQFSSRVMNRIKTSETGSVQEWIAGLLDKLLTPQTFRIRPAYGLVVLLLMLTTLSMPFYFVEGTEQTTTEGIEQSVQTVSETESRVWLRFIYIDKEAESVAVAGDFSNWDPISLTRQRINGEQVWTGLVPMTRGEHHYMFVKNGAQWVTDPLATVQREDGFGHKNAVIYL